ncbi:MAG: response regulator [Candidatus Eremiobacteraeota bacterium]|nr:response regulator [Candidatus Eremiobacteraeota bacterium]
MRVLIADDSAVQRRKIASYLKPLGVEILEAPDGAEAFDMLKERQVELLITDWNMPRMDGLCLVKAVRAEAKLGDIPILMVTTENDPWSVTRAIRSGANEYLMKPFDDESLLSKLRGALGWDHRLFERLPPCS